MPHSALPTQFPNQKPLNLVKPVRSPGYYARKRLLNNRGACFGMAFILISLIIALLGHLIMPDATPYVNDSAVQIGKKSPGFSVQFLKLRKNAETETVRVFQRLLFGQESEYSIIPITSYRIEDLTVYVKSYGSKRGEEAYSIVDAVEPLFIGDSKKWHSNQYFKVEGNVVTYLDVNENSHTISKEALVEQFKRENIETRHYLLGTDKAGRDMLSRLLFGFRISLGIGFMAVLISMAVGVTMGAIAGFFGGVLDQVVMWIMTVVWSIPGIMLVIAISIALQSRSVWVVFVAVGLTTWVEIARVVRGQIMGVKQKLYIEAARSLGIGNGRIIVFHILPNIMGAMIVIATSNFATAILTEAGLSFLGMGVQPPMPSWGVMINEGFNTIGSRNSGHLVFLPGMCVSLLVLAFNLFGNGLRDALDPNTLLK